MGSYYLDGREIKVTIQDGATINAFVTAVGAKGEQGIQGIQGIQGPPGNDGIAGPAGGDTQPVGTIVVWGTNTAPTNWLMCDGSAVSRTTYSALFGVIGTTYGVGDGSTTFNLPNIKGRTVVGRDAAQTEFDTLGETGGAKTHTLTVDEMPSHTHDTNIFFAGAGIVHYSVLAAQSPTPISTSATGGGQAHNNLQPYIVENYIIKAFTSSSVTALVVDNMLSTSATDALSAKQGKILRDTLDSVYLPVDYNLFRCTTNTQGGANVTIPLTKMKGGLTLASNLITLQKGYLYELDVNFGLETIGAAQITIANTSNVSQLDRIQHAWTTNAHDAGFTSTTGYGIIDLTSAGSDLQVKALVVAASPTPPYIGSTYGQLVIRKMKKVTI